MIVSLINQDMIYSHSHSIFLCLNGTLFSLKELKKQGDNMHTSDAQIRSDHPYLFLCIYCIIHMPPIQMNYIRDLHPYGHYSTLTVPAGYTALNYVKECKLSELTSYILCLYVELM